MKTQFLKYFWMVSFIILCVGCGSYKPLLNLKGKKVFGKIIDRDSNQAMIGLSIVEYDKYHNGTYTDTLGRFELILEGVHPVVVISGYYEAIFVEINPDEYNLIVLEEGIIKKSRKLIKCVTKFQH